MILSYLMLLPSANASFPLFEMMASNKKQSPVLTFLDLPHVIVTDRVWSKYGSLRASLNRWLINVASFISLVSRNDKICTRQSLLRMSNNDGVGARALLGAKIQWIQCQHMMRQKGKRRAKAKSCCTSARPSCLWQHNRLELHHYCCSKSTKAKDAQGLTNSKLQKKTPSDAETTLLLQRARRHYAHHSLHGTTTVARRLLSVFLLTACCIH